MPTNDMESSTTYFEPNSMGYSPPQTPGRGEDEGHQHGHEECREMASF